MTHGTMTGPIWLCAAFARLEMPPHLQFWPLVCSWALDILWLLTVCSHSLGGPCLEADSCQGPRVGAAEGIQSTLCSCCIPSAASYSLVNGSHLLGSPEASQCLNVVYMPNRLCGLVGSERFLCLQLLEP